MINLNESIKRLMTGLVLITIFSLSYVHSRALFCSLLALIIIIVVEFELPLLMHINGLKSILLAGVYPVLPFIQLIYLALQYYDADFYLPIYPIIIAWTADTAGYLVGKVLGKHKICPSISPGKSWEGFVGSALGVFAMHLWLLPKINLFATTALISNMWLLALFSIAITGIAFSGGLLLSYLKRKKGLKDAGFLLPGHGGFLDRFDAALFVATATIILTMILQ
jgi:phosphatidate cytidylyltransferase